MVQMCGVKVYEVTVGVWRSIRRGIVRAKTALKDEDEEGHRIEIVVVVLKAFWCLRRFSSPKLDAARKTGQDGPQEGAWDRF